MGATDFTTTAKGKTVNEAFSNAVDDARHEHGHGGYTGTIAEKSEFVMISVPEGTNPRKHAADLIENMDPSIEDKWGPAGCI